MNRDTRDSSRTPAPRQKLGNDQDNRHEPQPPGPPPTSRPPYDPHLDHSEHIVHDDQYYQR